MVSTQTTDKCHRCKTHVPLTDEEIERICMTYQSPRQAARAIERAHGIEAQPAPCPDCRGIGYDASGQLCGCQPW